MSHTNRRFCFLVALSLVFFLHVTDAQATRWTCERIKPFDTKINFRFVTSEPLLDYNYDLLTIKRNNNQLKRLWLSGNKLEELWMANDSDAGALSMGGWSGTYKLQMEAVERPGKKYFFCGFFKSVDIELHYHSRMFMPKEYPDQSCPYSFVLDHELKHHGAAIKSVKLFEDRIHNQLDEMVRDAEVKDGYHRSGYTQTQFGAMQNDLKEAIKMYINDYMKGEIGFQNNKIDTLEEKKKMRAGIDDCKSKMKAAKGTDR